MTRLKPGQIHPKSLHAEEEQEIKPCPYGIQSKLYFTPHTRFPQPVLLTVWGESIGLIINLIDIEINTLTM